jgi:hypothetical protein
MIDKNFQFMFNLDEMDQHKFKKHIMPTNLYKLGRDKSIKDLVQNMHADIDATHCPF